MCLPPTASQYLSKLARLRPSSVSPNSLDSSPNLLDHGLQVHLQTRSIPASKRISNVAQSRLPIASPHSLDRSLKVHLHTRSIAASMCISNVAGSWPPSASPKSLDDDRHVHLPTRWITGFKCIFKLPRLWPPSVLNHGLQCIANLTRSQPRRVSLSLLDHHFQAHLELLSSTACSQSRYTVCRWVVIWIHIYIDENTN
jgi:hypothetical protein